MVSNASNWDWSDHFDDDDSLEEGGAEMTVSMPLPPELVGLPIRALTESHQVGDLVLVRRYEFEAGAVLGGGDGE